MIINKEKIQQIRDLIKNHYNALIFKIAGRENLTDQELQALIDAGLIDVSDDGGKIKDGYYIGRARNTLDPRLRDDMTLNQFNKQLRHTAQTITDKEQYAIEHISLSAGNFLTNIREKARVSIEQIINDNNLEYRNKILTDTVRSPLIEGIEQNQTIMQIASDLREKTSDLFRDWKRVATTELTSAMNLGEADAIVSRNKGRSPDEIYVYKRINNDAATCVYCRKAYTLSNGLTPRVFKLSELQANGSNYGKKAVDYKPTITSMHPNCRCSLVEIPNGWTFNDAGQMIYKTPNYIRHQDQ